MTNVNRDRGRLLVPLGHTIQSKREGHDRNAITIEAQPIASELCSGVVIIAAVSDEEELE